MFWTALLLTIPLGIKPREDRDVREYVTRHFFREVVDTPMISVTEAAREHILARGGTIYFLDTKPVGLCCGRVAFEPPLTLGVPAKPERYTMNVINDIQVYIPKRFAVAYPLTIDVKKKFGRKFLRIDGWRLV